MRPICQSGLDCLDQDVRAVIGSSAVDVDGVRKGRFILLDKCLSTRILGRIYHSNRSIDRAAPCRLNGRGKRRSHDAIASTIGKICQSRHLPHLLANQRTACGVNAAKVDRIGMH